MNITISLQSTDTSLTGELSNIQFALQDSTGQQLGSAMSDSAGTLTFTNVNTDGTDLTLIVDGQYYAQQEAAMRPIPTPGAPDVPPQIFAAGTGAVPCGVAWYKGNVVQYSYAFVGIGAESGRSPVTSYTVGDSNAFPTLQLQMYSGTTHVSINIYRQVTLSGESTPLPEILLATITNGCGNLTTFTDTMG